MFILKKNLQNQQANSNQTWHKSSLGKGPGHLQRGDNLKNAKMGWVDLKIFFRTSDPE
jgi:hypothetical protein